MSRGFTLIELMVVVLIGMLLVGGATMSTSKYLAKEKLASSAKEVTALVNLARSMAVTSQVPPGFVGLDYVALTLTSGGLVTIYPVNNISGIGSSYVSKSLSNSGISYTPITLGGLLFAANSGKLLGKNADPSYISYPLSSATSVGITIASPEVSETRQIIISSFGAINSFKL